MILEAKNLSFRYEESGRKILDQFSLQVDSSERVGILAPSGFGKTLTAGSCCAAFTMKPSTASAPVSMTGGISGSRG